MNFSDAQQAGLTGLCGRSSWIEQHWSTLGLRSNSNHERFFGEGLMFWVKIMVVFPPGIVFPSGIALSPALTPASGEQGKEAVAALSFGRAGTSRTDCCLPAAAPSLPRRYQQVAEAAFAAMPDKPGKSIPQAGTRCRRARWTAVDWVTFPASSGAPSDCLPSGINFLSVIRAAPCRPGHRHHHGCDYFNEDVAGQAVRTSCGAPYSAVGCRPQSPALGTRGRWPTTPGIIFGRGRCATGSDSGT